MVGLNGESIVSQHLGIMDIVDCSGKCSGQFQVRRGNEEKNGKGDREIDRGSREEQDEERDRANEEIISPASYVNVFVDQSSGDNRRHSLSAKGDTGQRQPTDDHGTQFFRRIVVRTLVRELGVLVSLFLFTMLPTLVHSEREWLSLMMFLLPTTGLTTNQMISPGGSSQGVIAVDFATHLLILGFNSVITAHLQDAPPTLSQCGNIRRLGGWQEFHHQHARGRRSVRCRWGRKRYNVRAPGMCHPIW
jgi:hypothetical protein